MAYKEVPAAREASQPDPLPPGAEIADQVFDEEARRIAAAPRLAVGAPARPPVKACQPRPRACHLWYGGELVILMSEPPSVSGPPGLYGFLPSVEIDLSSSRSFRLGSMKAARWCPGQQWLLARDPRLLPPGAHAIPAAPPQSVFSRCPGLDGRVRDPDTWRKPTIPAWGSGAAGGGARARGVTGSAWPRPSEEERPEPAPPGR
jgi:hypothetical protein